VKLVKVDVDANKLIASQFRVQSIPTVYAMFQGQLVADLTPMRSESQLRAALDQILGQLPVQGEEQQQEQEIAPLIAMGEEVLASGDAARALSVFEQLADMAPETPAITGGRARALLQLGRADEAQALLDAIEGEAAKDAAITQAKAALALAREAQPVDDLAGLIAQVEASPDDLDARFRLAGGLMAVGDRDRAADALLDIIGRDRDWNEGAARERLLKLFEAVGLADPWVNAQRRRLSALLFA
jgi:putative thioredoxin